MLHEEPVPTLIFGIPGDRAKALPIVANKSAGNGLTLTDIEALTMGVVLDVKPVGLPDHGLDEGFN